MKFANFVYFSITHAKLISFFDRGINLPCAILKYTKFTNFIGSYLAHFNLQHFASKLSISTNFGTPFAFNAVAMSCTISRFLTIVSIMQYVGPFSDAANSFSSLLNACM